MERCGSCGKSVTEGKRACLSCGAPLASSPLVTAEAEAAEPAPRRATDLLEAAKFFRQLDQRQKFCGALP